MVSGFRQLTYQINGIETVKTSAFIATNPEALVLSFRFADPTGLFQTLQKRA